MDWVDEELKTVNLGDKRLDDRFGLLLRRLGDAPQFSIPTACRGLGETIAAYRFFDNDKVSTEKILEPHYAATLERLRSNPVVLLPQDTTELDYSDHPQTHGLGPLNRESRLGFHQHLTLALTPERLCLGVVDVRIWARERLREKREYKRLPIEEKESERWLWGYQCACRVAAESPATRVVSIADRDADIYELFLRAMEARTSGAGYADWIVRAKENRRLANVDETLHLRESLRRAPVIATVPIRLPRTPKRAARETTVVVRAQQGLDPRPPYRAQRRLPQARLNAVWVSELNAPADQEPVDWLLLTSLSVESAEQALMVVDYYCSRWQIEVFFRVLKTGCRIEKLQLEDESRLKPCIALYLIVAWRVLFVTALGRACPQMPCSVLFEDAEWKALWTLTRKSPLPEQPPPLEQMIAMVASLGGYLARKGDCAPGPTAIWIGLQRTRDFAEAWRMFGPETRGKRCV